MKKLILVLLVAVFAAKFYFGDKEPVTVAQTPEQQQEQLERIQTGSARTLCRMLVTDNAKFKDTVEFQSIRTADTPQGGVLVQMDFSAENRFGTAARHSSSCNVLDQEVILFTVDDKVLIEKNIDQS